MKSQLIFTPEVLTCCTLYNHWNYYYLTLLVIYEHLNILTLFCYNLPTNASGTHRQQPIKLQGAKYKATEVSQI